MVLLKGACEGEGSPLEMGVLGTKKEGRRNELRVD